MSTQPTPSCIYCGRNASQVPLLSFLYQDQEFQICAEHLPILLHQPGKLAGKLPGADTLSPAKHD
ncbi:MAG: hypothetical protein ACK2TT_08540 [Anaerolineales bacterium]|jgi:hypothetical protein